MPIRCLLPTGKKESKSGCVCVGWTERRGVRWAGAGIQLWAVLRRAWLGAGGAGSSAGTCLHPSSGAPQALGTAEKLACPAAWACCLHCISWDFQSCPTKVNPQQFQDVAQEHTESIWQEYHCVQICFGMQVKVGVITFMNHWGNREIIFFIDLCTIALISVSTLCSYGKLYGHYSFKQ